MRLGGEHTHQVYEVVGKVKMVREKRYLIGSMVLAVVALGVLVAGIAAQGGIDWSQSDILPNATSVEAGNQITFTIQAVNSSTVTAKNVILSSEIPHGTEYVSVTGGAFVITDTVGAELSGLVSGLSTDGQPEATLPGGVSLGDPVSLDDIDPEDVKYIGWEGNVGPGLENAVSFDLVLDVKPDAGSVVTYTQYVLHNSYLVFEEDVSVEVTGSVPAQKTVIYLPAVRSAPATTVTMKAPLIAQYSAISRAPTVAEVLAGEGEFDQVLDYNAKAGVYIDEFDADYCEVERAVYVFDLPDGLTAKQVVSAKLRAYGSDLPGDPRLPLIVSRATPRMLDDYEDLQFTPRDVFYGREGESWEWWLPPSNGTWQAVTVCIPVERVDWTRDKVAIHMRNGVEDRPDLWIDGSVYMQSVTHIDTDRLALELTVRQ